MALIRISLSIIAGTIGLILVAPLFIVALSVWIIALLTCAVARLIEPQFLTRDQITEFDPEVGWKPRPNLNTHHVMGDLFQLSTDAQGWRGKFSLEESEMVIFGDSFAAGYGVGDQHLFANISTNPRMKPIGIGGYSMVQELLWMKRLAPKLQGKMVVWFIYHGNDLYDNLSPDLRGYRKPFLRESKQDGEWEIVSRHITPDRWTIVTRVRLEGWYHPAKLAELCSDTFLSKRAYSACEYLIREGKELCFASGAGLMVLTIPEVSQLTPEGQRILQTRGGDAKTFDPTLPDQKIEAACRRLGVDFLAGRTFLDAGCYKIKDCHWNPKGHRKVAEMLRRLYAEQQSQSQARGLTSRKVFAEV